MNQDAKKTALRMIPYAIYVLPADDGKGNVAAATVNWVTKPAFNPPLVVVGVKTDSGAYSIVKNTKSFVLNMLGKEHKGLAFTFFKPAQLEGGKLSGQAIHKGANGAPILDAALAAVECKVTSVVEQGDHHIVVVGVAENRLRVPGAILLVLVGVLLALVPGLPTVELAHELVLLLVLPPLIYS